jgi:hypothetical protein
VESAPWVEADDTVWYASAGHFGADSIGNHFVSVIVSSPPSLSLHILPRLNYGSGRADGRGRPCTWTLTGILA